MDIGVEAHPQFVGNVARIVTPRQVRKRDGATLQPFSVSKVENAIRSAWKSSGKRVDEAKIKLVTQNVIRTLHGDTTDVEKIQDVVEVALMHHDCFQVAKSYILYRQKRAEQRITRKKPDPQAIADYIHFSKYARYQSNLLRREIYSETVARVEDMHLRRFAHLPALLPEIRWAFDQVRDKRVLPAMRTFQFAGKAIETNNNRMFNCCATLADRPRVFAEAMFLLLCGSGVGYSVQFDHVDKLPPLKRIDTKNVVHHVVEDSIEGWANALDALILSYIHGYYVELSYHLIRPAGAPLKTSGGRAPGHLRLKESLERIRDVLNGAQGRKLRPIEVHSIFCLCADAVLSGGIRRSAMICLFSPEDSEMLYCKTSDWYHTNPWFANANNSIVFKRNEVKKKQFKRVFEMIKGWGEPGILFTEDNDYVTNPCGEIGLNPKLIVNAETRPLIEAKLGKTMTDSIPDGTTYTGWGICNLCEINAAKFTTFEDFVHAAHAATIIGTLQASYTRFPYLGWQSEVLAERGALIGVGMTGMLDAPHIACKPEYQRLIANNVKEWNAEIAAKIGIRPAARTTCIKPGGTTSLELGCVGSGHHAHHAKRYIRRVVADELEMVFQSFKKLNPHMCAKKPDGKWILEFPVEAPEGAIVKEDLTALSFLDMIKSTQQNWVLPGIARPESSPGLTHNVSNTVHVLPTEWDKVAEYIWENRSLFTGVALLSHRGDKDYAFSPFEAVVNDVDEAHWNQLVANYQPLNYAEILETEDGTNVTAELACAGGACAV